MSAARSYSYKPLHTHAWRWATRRRHPLTTKYSSFLFASITHIKEITRSPQLEYDMTITTTICIVIGHAVRCGSSLVHTQNHNLKFKIKQNAWWVFSGAWMLWQFYVSSFGTPTFCAERQVTACRNEISTFHLQHFRLPPIQIIILQQGCMRVCMQIST